MTVTSEQFRGRSMVWYTWHTHWDFIDRGTIAVPKNVPEGAIQVYMSAIDARALAFEVWNARESQ